MKLDALHKRFSRDATYRRAYDELGGWVELGLRCRSLRERAGLSKTALAAKLSLSLHALTEFERGDERRPEIILHILNHWESALVAEGFDAGTGALIGCPWKRGHFAGFRFPGPVVPLTDVASPILDI